MNERHPRLLALLPLALLAGLAGAGCAGPPLPPGSLGGMVSATTPAELSPVTAPGQWNYDPASIFANSPSR